MNITQKYLIWIAKLQKIHLKNKDFLHISHKQDKQIVYYQTIELALLESLKENYHRADAYFFK